MYRCVYRSAFIHSNVTAHTPLDVAHSLLTIIPTGEVTLRFRRAQPTTDQSSSSTAHLLSRLPSIYGLDFAGGGQRRPQQQPTVEEPTLLVEPDHRQGFVVKWNLCGRGEVGRALLAVAPGGLRLEAAALLVPPEEEEEEVSPGDGDSPQRQWRGKRRRQRRLPVGILVGCAGRGLGAWEVVLSSSSSEEEEGESDKRGGGLDAVPLVGWEGGWAVGSLDLMEVHLLPSSGKRRAFVVCGADGGGRLWRWVLMEDLVDQQQQWWVAGGRVEGAGLPAAAARLRGLRSAPGELGSR